MGNGESQAGEGIIKGRQGAELGDTGKTERMREGRGGRKAEGRQGGGGAGGGEGGQSGRQGGKAGPEGKAGEKEDRLEARADLQCFAVTLSATDGAQWWKRQATFVVAWDASVEGRQAGGVLHTWNWSAMILKARPARGWLSSGFLVICCSGSSTAVPCTTKIAMLSPPEIRE